MGGALGGGGGDWGATAAARPGACHTAHARTQRPCAWTPRASLSSMARWRPSVPVPAIWQQVRLPRGCERARACAPLPQQLARAGQGACLPCWPRCSHSHARPSAAATQLFVWDPDTLQLRSSGLPGGCLDANVPAVHPYWTNSWFFTVSPCSPDNPNQHFQYLAETGQVANVATTHCLNLGELRPVEGQGCNGAAFLGNCNGNAQLTLGQRFQVFAW